MEDLSLLTAWTLFFFLLHRVRCHIVHLSSAEPLKLIEEARQAGAPLTVETTHHYLNLCAESIPAGATQFKCCPPIRSSANQVRQTVLTCRRNTHVCCHVQSLRALFSALQEQLWSALKRGLIDMVVSDHSPCTPDLKKLDCGDFMQAWGGISSLQFGTVGSEVKLECLWSSAPLLSDKLAHFGVWNVDHIFPLLLLILFLHLCYVP